MKILVISANFYQDIADMMVEGARESLAQAAANVDVITVPGALEIPPAIAIAASRDIYDGFVALGCVIRGETSHYDTVCNESARGIMDLGVREKLAIGNGILTVESRDQALERADKTRKNKGAGAAEACLALIALHNQMA